VWGEDTNNHWIIW